MKTTQILPLLAAFAGLLLPSLSRAEVSEVRIASQPGLGYMPVMIMQDQKLVEKHAKTQGIPDLKATYFVFANGATITDGLLSGNLEFGSGSWSIFTTLWAKTKGGIGIRSPGAMNCMPLYLNTRNPNVKSLKDFTDKDKIALPTVKVSAQALALQQACEKEFGVGQHGKLDSITVSMSHPDGMAQLLNGVSEINSHLTAPPYQEIELTKPGIRRVLNSYDTAGGAVTFNVFWGTQKFKDENPKAYAAVAAALEEALDFINKDHKAAAEAYLRASKDKVSLEDTLKLLGEKEIEFGIAPKNMMKGVDFLHRIGTIKTKPADWKELFFENVHGKAGS